MLIFSAVVAGLAVATLRYHPAPPADVPLSPPQESTAVAVPPPPHAPAPPPAVKPVVAAPPVAPSNPPKTKTP
jgi:hypothetical protein